MKTPQVSIVIPAYNHEKFVGEAIQSVLDQTFPDFELIIINDGSTDHTEAEILKFKDDRIQYYSQENRGLSATLNRGVELARGQYFNFLPSDDAFFPEKLEVQLKVFKGGPELGVVFAYPLLVDAKGREMKDDPAVLWPIVSYETKEEIFPALFERNFLSAPTALMRIDCLKKAGLFDESLKYAQDYDLWMRILKHYDARLLKQPLVKYRWHGGNLTFRFTLETELERALVLVKASMNLSMKEIFPHLHRGQESNDDFLSYKAMSNYLERNDIPAFVPLSQIYREMARFLESSFSNLSEGDEKKEEADARSLTLKEHVEKDKLWTLLNKAIVERNSQILQATAEKEALTSRISQVTAERETLAAQVSQVTAERETLAAQVSQVTAEREALTAQVSQVTAEREALTTQVAQINSEKAGLWNQLNRIYSSDFWKAAAFYYRVRNKFLKYPHRFLQLWRKESFERALSEARSWLPVPRRPHPEPATSPKAHADSPRKVLERTEEPSAKHRAPTAMLVRDFHEGGLEKVVIDLAQQFNRQGLTCPILVVNTGGRAANQATEQGLDVRVFHGDTSRLVSQAQSEGLSTVFTHHCYEAIEDLARADVKLVEVIHNAYHWQRGESWLGDLRNRCFTAYVGVSAFVSSYAINHLHLPAAKVRTIENGLSRVGLIRPPLQIVTEQRLAAIANPLLVHVANAHPQKNHLAVLRAFLRVRERFPTARLVFAGVIDEKTGVGRQLLSEIRDAGTEAGIECTGPLGQRALSQLMTKAHVGLLPSAFEGFSIGSLELTYFALPIVLSETGGANWLTDRYGHVSIAANTAVPAEALSPEGIEGFCMKPTGEAVCSIAEAIEKVLSDYPTYAAAALEAGRQWPDYSIEKVADRYLDLIQEITE